MMKNQSLKTKSSQKKATKSMNKPPTVKRVKKTKSNLGKTNQLLK
jgi:hypothetical protein